MRIPDTPLPGDIVIRCREDGTSLRKNDTFVLTRWPDTDTVYGGPYQSYGYALRQARSMIGAADGRVWRDHTRQGEPERRLEDVTE
jgi:hypothetical protein